MAGSDRIRGPLGCVREQLLHLKAGALQHPDHLSDGVDVVDHPGPLDPPGGVLEGEIAHQTAVLIGQQ